MAMALHFRPGRVGPVSSVVWNGFGKGQMLPWCRWLASGLHLWAGLPKQSLVTDWYELLWQVSQRLKLEDFLLEALKGFSDASLGFDDGCFRPE